MIFVGNLVDIIIAVICTHNTLKPTYVLSDNTGVSTPELITTMAQALQQKERLWYFPPALLKLAAIALGKKKEILRLTESLSIDSNAIYHDLAIRPKFTFDAGIKATLEDLQ